MPIVRGDRIGESQKLNRRSVEAQDFYSACVAVVPDDFGRCRWSPAHVFLRMYPRREPTTALLRRVERLMKELEGENGDALVRTWDVDGVTFAEFTGWSPRGNRYHRSPEPPWSSHVHGGACLSTAIHRAIEWGLREEAITLSSQLKELRDRKRTGAVPGPDREVAPPSPPSPPSPLTKNGSCHPDIRAIFDAWVIATGRSAQRTVLTSGRETKIRARLRDYPIEDLLAAVRGVSLSDWHMGRDAKTRGKKYDDFDTIFRDGQQVEKFRDMWLKAQQPEPPKLELVRPSHMTEDFKRLEREAAEARRERQKSAK